jgi:surfeit locus 1 family protein
MNYAARTPRRRRGVLVAGFLSLLGIAVLLALGSWQLERKTWKEQLIAKLTERIAGSPRPLPARESWQRLSQEDLEFRRVAFPAEFLHEHEALVHSSGSAFRPDVSGPGYWVFTPVRLVGGSLVMVNRGFVPEGRQDPKTRPDGQVKGFVDLVGVMRWPEPRGSFTPSDNPTRNIWYVRDHLAIAGAKDLGTVAPFYLELEAPTPPGGVPRSGKLAVNLANNHSQYALTWFGLAAGLFAVFTIWALQRLRSAEA